MRVAVEVIWESDIQDLDSDHVHYEKALYWLLYWGLDYTIIELDEYHRMSANFTFGVCKHQKTVNVECFGPEMIRILGREI